MVEELLQRRSAPGIDRLVAGAVVHAGQRVVALRRSNEDGFLPGIEELPSGGCDPGETILEGLTRELGEEIGWVGRLDLDPGFVGHFDYRDSEGNLTRQYTFAVPLGDREVRISREHSSWRWLPIDSLDASDFTPQSTRMVIEWQAHLHSCSSPNLR